ncbi:MAG: outer membrane protein assembly factor BamD [Bacteroidetes bacterium]|nr:outer membrane protein assembly factor BamD [Bacteroidota bacterium]
MVLSRLFALLLLFLAIFPSCSGYEQLLKSDDFDLKYEKAREYYNKGSYSRALPLFKQLLSVEKGTPREEELMYYIAYSHYGQNDHLIASSLFKNYYTFFPNTARSTECHYMSAYCNYLASPKVSLDQTVTYKAIESFQLFVNAHPKSDSVQAANRMIDLMRRKLETKALSAADLYYKTRNYQAAAIAYTNLLNDFPDIPQAEYINFLVLQSYFEFAEQSTVCKQADRYGQALNTSAKFKELYPESNLLDQAESIQERSAVLRTEAAEECIEQERSRAYLFAEASLRNKDYEKSVRLWESYRTTYSNRSDLDQVQLNILRSRYRLALETVPACSALPEYEKALAAYYYFADEFPGSALLEQAEDVYEDLLESQDQSKKNCDELH